MRGIDGTQVHRCPVALREWKERQHTFKCDTRSGLAYTCVRSILGHFWEQCYFDFWIERGNIYFVVSFGHLTWSQLLVTP